MVVAAGFVLSADFSKARPQALSRHDSPQTTIKDTDWAFARHLLSAIRVIEENHVTPTTNTQMVQWAVEGLYNQQKKAVPVEIGKRLKRLEKANHEELLQLLHDVRADLGPRKELEDDKDLELSLQAIFLQLEPGARPEDRSRLFRQEWT
jgi:hypothetical protein